MIVKVRSFYDHKKIDVTGSLYKGCRGIIMFDDDKFINGYKNVSLGWSFDNV